MGGTGVTGVARARGCLLGLACGDALGRPVEFTSAAEIRERHGEVTEMLGQGTYGKPAGTVTDDTELAMCVAESLVACGGFDAEDVAERFVAWLEADPFDVGLMTREAIERLREGTPPDEAGRAVWESRAEGQNAGNGSVMRCAPHAVAFRYDDAELARVSRASSAITHADPRCQHGCVILNRTLAGLLRGEDDPLGRALQVTTAAPDGLRAALKRVRTVLAGAADPAALEEELSPSGYVVDTLQTALFDGLVADSVERAVVQAVARGGDTDTVGAVAGAVAGARFGERDVPDRWLREVDEADRLRELADELVALGEPGGDGRR